MPTHDRVPQKKMCPPRKSSGGKSEASAGYLIAPNCQVKINFVISAITIIFNEMGVY